MKALFAALSSTDFSEMGRGIEQRYARCRGWWEPHLRCTRDFIARNLSSCERLAVLGAGRLLDIELSALLARSSEVHLFDADSACLPTWRSAAGTHFGRRVIPHIEEVTGVLELWSAPLRAVVRRGALVEYLRQLTAEKPRWAEGQFDAIISLNLAGQIPLYWRDRVLAIKPMLTWSEQQSLHLSMGELQRAHFHGLLADPHRVSMVVTDTEYYYYDSDLSEWEVEDALYGAASSIFRGDFAAEGAESWLWHLAPQYIESETEGEIHRVEARIRRKPHETAEGSAATHKKPRQL